MTDNGKAPAYNPETNGAHGTNGISRSAPRSDEPIVKVQPPRREDLQPSYARVIEPDDADADNHGWYGGMVCFKLVSPNNVHLTRHPGQRAR